MAILDNNLLFSNAQKITNTANSDVIDFKEPGDAVGQELTIRAIVAEEFAGLTSLQIKLQTGETPSEFKDVLMTPAIPAAELKRGKEIFKVRTPSGLKRYARINYVVSGNASAGAVTAYMSKEL
jgi:hypothetical protein